MEYAMKSLSLLYPKSLSRYTAVSTSVVTQQQLSEPSAEAPKARPCRVTTADRSVRKGIMAHSLEDLHVKVRDTLMLAYKPFFLVLEEDGTTVETEEYFQSLADDTVFMVLHKGQKWQPPSEQSTRYQLALSDKPAKIDVARVTFDLYKVNPQDFIGCLNVKATLYGTYSLSYDLHCSGAKRIMKHQLQRRGASKPSDPSGDQPFPGLLRPGTFSREELVDVLRAAVVDRKGPLVTLNKPQGLPVTGKPGELTLLSVLPELSRSLGLGEQELQVVRASGKEASGLVLLSSCPQTASRLQKFFTHSQRARRPTATYCAVTDGIPVTSEGKIQAALKLEHIDGVNLVVPVQSPSRKDIMEGVKRTLSHFRVVATGSGCALVQLQPLTVFPSQLQAHMALQLCPVLGDHTYSARVGTVLGQRFLLPVESTKPQRQVLDEALLGRLCLTPSQAARLPLHLHLHCLRLPGARPRDPPIELLAPLPSYFSRTLQCLGLHYQ